MGGTELCRDGKPAALHPEALEEHKTSLFSLSLFFLNLIALYVNECFAYIMHVCQCPQRSAEDTGSSGTGATESCEPP